MDAAQFPYTRQSDAEMQEDTSKPGANVPTTGVSLRSTKPTWSNKKNSVGVSGKRRVMHLYCPNTNFIHSYTQGTSRTPTGARLIIFVAGGMTYSEMRSAYEIADIHNREVIIGKK